MHTIFNTFIFSDLATLQLALLGIQVSVLSLVFAVLVGKREEHRTIKHETSNYANNRRIALSKSIKGLSCFCKRIIAIIFILLVLYLLSMIAPAVFCGCSFYVAHLIDIVGTIFTIIWIGALSYSIWHDINKD